LKVNKRSRSIDSGEVLKEESFSIGNVGLVMNILTSKIYSDPKKALVQEVTSNARDAHREFGNPDRPIQITLPSKDAPNLIIRDYGPGINPSRMSNVFTKYGKSTKRSDNKQTGGFGLGAKSPWAYSDSFQIITWVYENKDDVIIQRTYNAFLDETGRGKLALLDETESIEEHGTAIIVPIKLEDFDDFEYWVDRSCRYWEVLPEVKQNGVICDAVFGCTNVECYTSVDWTLFSGVGTPFALVDRIRYPIDINKIYKNEENIPSYIKILGTFNIGIYFETGEIGLTANREDIELRDRSVVKYLKDKLKRVYQELYNKILEDFNSVDDIIDVNLKWQDTPYHVRRLLDNKITWRDIKIPSSPILYDYQHHRVQIIEYTRGCNFNREHRVKSRKVDYIPYSAYSMILKKDVPEKDCRSRIESLFIQNEDNDIQMVYVIDESHIDLSELDLLHERKKQHDLNNISYFTFGKVSDYDKNKSRLKKKSPVTVKILEFKQWKSIDIDLDKIKDAYYLLGHRSDSYCLIKDSNGDEIKINFEKNIIHSLKKEYGIEVYCIPKRFKDKINDNLTPISEFIIDKYNKFIDNPELKEAYKYGDIVEDNGYGLDLAWTTLDSCSLVSHFDSSHILSAFMRDYQKWLYSDSLIREFNSFCRNFEKLLDHTNIRNVILEYEKHTMPSIDYWTLLSEEYPMLMYFFGRYRPSIIDYIEPLKEYITAMDFYKRNNGENNDN
jgi:hypothetical protein